MRKPVRNILIFTLVSLGGGFVGLALDRLAPPQNPMQGLGALLWLISPLLANILLRAFGGDGWKDLGLLPNLKSGWVWYLAALLIIPLAVLPSLGVGALFGALALPGLTAQGLAAFLPLAGAAFGMSMVKNLFEEFAWRGYLTPRFEALRLNPFLNALLTGLIWAGWHLPYYLYFLDRAELEAHTPLSLPAFILLSFLVLPLHAFAYGELRLVSGSTWTAWLLHTAANAISMTLITSSFVTLSRSFAGVVFTPGTEGLLHSLMMGLIGYALYRYRRHKSGSHA